jgi:cytosine/adenosine deaminase-related metal-dependent hydrolase
VSTLALRDVTAVPMDRWGRVVRGNLLVKDGRIASLGSQQVQAERTIDLAGGLVLPGLVQTHVHLCQTILRGSAEGRSLLPWLEDVVWPLEAAMDAQDVYRSSLLGCAELLSGGTTTVMDMGPARHGDAVFEACRDSGIRATTGNSVMDSPEADAAGLSESPQEVLSRARLLRDRWHGAAEGRLRYCYAPRFPLGCSSELLTAIAAAAKADAVAIHTHLAENEEEGARVVARLGMTSAEFLKATGILGPQTVVAHGVHTGPQEWSLLAETGTAVAHCPSSNLKLGSGIAPVRELREHGVLVGLGADGAPCNNRLDAFEEMRLCALLANLSSGPGRLPAWEVLSMATAGGAASIGLGDELGTLEVGKRADIIAVDLAGYHCLPSALADHATRIVFSARASDVVLTVVEGRVLYTRTDGLVDASLQDLRAVEDAAVRLGQRVGRVGEGEQRGD